MASAEVSVNVRVNVIPGDACDIETGDLMLPIRNGLFEGHGVVSVLSWTPGSGIERTIMNGPWGPVTLRVGRYAGRWCWYQIDPPTCPFGRDEYMNMAYTLGRGYIWPETRTEEREASRPYRHDNVA